MLLTLLDIIVFLFVFCLFAQVANKRFIYYKQLFPTLLDIINSSLFIIYYKQLLTLL